MSRLPRVRHALRHPIWALGVELVNLACWTGLWDRIPHHRRMRIWKALGMVPEGQR